MLKVIHENGEDYYNIEDISFINIVRDKMEVYIRMNSRDGFTYTFDKDDEFVSVVQAIRDIYQPITFE